MEFWGLRSESQESENQLDHFSGSSSDSGRLDDVDDDCEEVSMNSEHFGVEQDSAGEDGVGSDQLESGRDNLLNSGMSYERDDLSDSASYQSEFSSDLNEDSSDDDYEESSSEDDTGSNEYSIFDDVRFLAFINYITNEQLSDETVKRLFPLMKLIYGVWPPFTTADVRRFWKRAEGNTIKKVLYLCASCQSEKTFRNEVCSTCRTTSSSLLDTTSVVVCDVRSQLTSILEQRGADIVEAHRKIHEKQEDFRPQDIRRFPAYKDLMETGAQFVQRDIHLLCTISSDAARFKKIARREVTPLLVQLEGLEIEQKQGGHNFVLVSTTYSDGGTKTAQADKIVQLTFDQLKDMSVQTIVENEVYTFKLIPFQFIGDMKEQSVLTRLPNWHQEEGCAKCYGKGQKRACGKYSYNCLYVCPERSDQDVLQSAEDCTHGFTDPNRPQVPRVPRAFEFIPPSRWSIDPFHVKNAGTLKELMAEMLKPVNWKPTGLSKETIGKVSTALNMSKSYTYDAVKLQPMAKKGKWTGREVEKSCISALALISFGELAKNDRMQLFLICQFILHWFTGTLLAHKINLDNLMLRTIRIHTAICADRISVKWHTFYFHLTSHEEKYGVLNTTERFEREHKNLMGSVHYQSTNSEKSLPTRYVIRQKVGFELQKKMISISEDDRDALQNSMKTTNKRLPKIGDSNEVARNELTQDDARLIADIPDNDRIKKFMRRVSVKSWLGNFIFSASSYWKRSVATCQSLITYESPLNGLFRFGSVRVIFEKDDHVWLIVEEYVVQSLGDQLSRLLGSKELNREEKDTIPFLFYFPCIGGKIIGSKFEPIPSSSILSPATIFPMGTELFVMMNR